QLPEPWRHEALAASPRHAHMLGSEVEKFRTFYRGQSRDDWHQRWCRWWERTMGRPPPKRGPARTAAEFKSGVTVHDTEEPLPEYTARMIREGKFRPNGQGPSPAEQQAQTGSTKP